MGWLLVAGIITASSLTGQLSKEAQEVELLARIRDVMVRNLDSVPNYACRQTIVRQAKVGRFAPFRRIDKFRIEVAFLQGREVYSSTGPGVFEEKDFSDLPAKGAIGTGSFALHSTDLFRRSAAKFTVCL